MGMRLAASRGDEGRFTNRPWGLAMRGIGDASGLRAAHARIAGAGTMVGNGCCGEMRASSGAHDVGGKGYPSWPRLLCFIMPWD